MDKSTGKVAGDVDMNDFGGGSTDGLVSTAGGLWWAGAGHANYIFLSSDMTNSFNKIAQAAILEAVTSRFGLRGVLKRYREET